jgi:uncharacterized membrane protein
MKRLIETKVIAWCFVCYAAISIINIDLISTWAEQYWVVCHKVIVWEIENIFMWKWRWSRWRNCLHMNCELSDFPLYHYKLGESRLDLWNSKTEHHLGLNSVRQQVLVSIRVLEIFVMCLAVWIQIAVLTCLVVISCFFQIQRNMYVSLTGLLCTFLCEFLSCCVSPCVYFSFDYK